MGLLGPLTSSYKDRLNQIPVNNGKWTGERGESTFLTDSQVVKLYIDEARVKDAEYKNLMPGFTPF